MSEGPQVRVTTDRLRRHLLGMTVHRCRTTRPNLEAFAEGVVGREVTRLWCKGKHIFVSFGDDLFLHNHLLMRGSWRRLQGRLLLLPEPMWLALELDRATVCNYRGQMLKMADSAHVERQLQSLGPDLLDEATTVTQIASALAADPRPVGEVLMDQAVLCGVGNVIKSETLFLAHVHPAAPCADLPEETITRLAHCVHRFMWDTYRAGGRWVQRVYRRTGQRCTACRSTIRMIRQGKSARTTYFCPGCQTL